ncbi:hypothetical protein D3C81_1963490 [compost metagenome]
MWVHEMTDEQKREYGFVDLNISEMNRLGYESENGNWKKVCIDAKRDKDKIQRIT